MLGGSAGQFVVGPLIHGTIVWQQFWTFSGLALVVLAVLVLLSAPAGDHARLAGSESILSIFKPYKIVLSNPQSYLCDSPPGCSSSRPPSST